MKEANLDRRGFGFIENIDFINQLKRRMDESFITILLNEVQLLYKIFIVTDKLLDTLQLQQKYKMFLMLSLLFSFFFFI